MSQSPLSPEAPAPVSPVNQFALNDEVEFRLPSGAVPYVKPDGTPWFDSPIVRIAPMRSVHEAVLLNQQLSLSARVDKIIEGCVKGLPLGFGVRNLTIKDRSLLVIFIRQHSVGANFSIVTACSKCNSPMEVDVDLNRDLDIETMPRTETYEDAKTGEVKERELRYDANAGFQTVLPKRKIGVAMRLLTGRDEDFILQEMAQVAKSRFIAGEARDNPAYFLNRALQIHALQLPGTSEWKVVNHSDPKQFRDLAQLLTTLSIVDVQHLDEFYQKHDVAFNAGFERVCPNAACGATVWIPLQMTLDFFRSTSL